MERHRKTDTLAPDGRHSTLRERAGFSGENLHDGQVSTDFDAIAQRFCAHTCDPPIVEDQIGQVHRAKWDFLNFIADHARRYQAFDLRMCARLPSSV